MIKLKIYYAHHIWKYGTKIEEYELELIKKTFPNAEIFNPSTDINQTENEEFIMKRCLEEVKQSDMVIFSSMNGCIGLGVSQEIDCAYRNNIKVSYLFANQIQDFSEIRFKQATILNDSTTRRVYMALNYT